MIRQDHDAPDLRRDRAQTIRLRTALWLSALFVPGIAKLRHVFEPANDGDEPLGAA